MHWPDVVLLIELVVLVAIYLDDHAMKNMAEESLQISKESLDAQKQYLDLRRKWYESRMKKKDDKTTSGSTPGGSSDAL